jgi:hypothetical protein
MLSRTLSNTMVQKADAVMRRLRSLKYRILGVRLQGESICGVFVYREIFMTS